MSSMAQYTLLSARQLPKLGGFTTVTCMLGRLLQALLQVDSCPVKHYFV